MKADPGHDKLARLRRRDWQLWSIALLLILALTATILAANAPHLVGAAGRVTSQLRVYLLGLTILVSLFSVYVIQTLFALKRMRFRVSFAEAEREEVRSLLDALEDHAARLRASEESHRTLLESSADTLLVVGLDNVVRYMNRAGERLFRCSVEDFLKKPFTHPLDVTQPSEIVISMPSTDARVVEMRTIETTWLGEPVRLASLRDITTRKQAEEALHKANENLQRLNRLKSDFLSTVSHELRTPLTSIKNATHLLVSEKAGPVNDDQRRFLEMTARNIDRLAGIVNDLLDLAKIEAGRMEFRFKDVALVETIHNVFGTFQPQAMATEIQLVMDCADDLPHVYADPMRIEQVLCNLLSNALKFTPKGGRVLISARATSGGVEASVEDTGIGISGEDQQRLFQRFVQAEDPLTRTHTGTGLGLAITKELLQVHGSDIGLDSALGRGSRFFFTLPAASGETREMLLLETILREARPSGTVGVLVVEPVSRPDGSQTGAESKTELRSLERLTRVVAQRAEDRIVVQPTFDRLVVLLPKTPLEGARVVCQKLAREYERRCSSAAVEGLRVPTIHGPVAFPKDGRTAHELVERALRLKTLDERSRDGQAHGVVSG